VPGGRIEAHLNWKKHGKNRRKPVPSAEKPTDRGQAVVPLFIFAYPHFLCSFAFGGPFPLLLARIQVPLGPYLGEALKTDCVSSYPICPKAICPKAICAKTFCAEAICATAVWPKAICGKAICGKAVCAKAV